MERNYPDNKIDRRTRSIIIACTFLMAAFSLWFLFPQSLRLDEAQSLWQTSQSVPKIFKLVAQDVHVPLYHLILHLLQFFLGNGVYAARSLSLFFALATIPAMYFLARSAVGRTVGFFATILLTISPFLSWYSSEIRMYSMLTFVTVLNQYFFIQIFKGNRGGWLGYVLTAWIGIFTHYFFAFTLLSQLVFFIFQSKYFSKDFWWKFLIVLVSVVIVFSPWVIYVYHLGFASNTRPQLTPPTPSNVFDAFSQFLFGFQDDRINSLILSFWPLLILFTFLRLQQRQKMPPVIRYFLIASILPIIGAFLVSITIIPFFLTRYLIVTVPALYIVMSWMIQTYQPQIARVLRVILVIVMLVALIGQAVSAKTPVKENFREASEYVSDNIAPQDVFVIAPPFTIYPVEYYYHGPASLDMIPEWDRFITGPIPNFDEATFEKQIDALKSTHRKLWLLLSFDQGYNEKIRLYMDTHFQRDEIRTFSPGLNLYVYQLRYD